MMDILTKTVIVAIKRLLFKLAQRLQRYFQQNHKQMRDLLLLPFYLMAIFSNSPEFGLSDLSYQEDKHAGKTEIKIDLQHWIDVSVSENLKSNKFNVENFKQELLDQSHKK